MALLTVDEEAQLKIVEDRLVSRFGEHVPSQRIHDVFARTLRQFDGAKIRAYVPVLVQHEVIDALRRRRLQ